MLIKILAIAALGIALAIYFIREINDDFDNHPKWM
jgi:hypothetical protein